MDSINKHFFYDFVFSKMRLYNEYKPHFISSEKLYFYKYDDQFSKVFIPYYMDSDFIVDKGTCYLDNMSFQEKALLASEMIYTYENESIKSVLTFNSNKKFSDIKLRAINPKEFKLKKVSHLEKIDKLLEILYKSNSEQDMFAPLNLTPIMAYKCNIATRLEIEKFLNHLTEKNLIAFRSELIDSKLENGFTAYTIFPTIEGYSHLNLKKQVDSKKVFIAMQFNWNCQENNLNNLIKDEFKNTLIRACKICGYDADIVSTNHTNYITDQIIREIRESKFVIADFTFNNGGAYYEAGFARALGKDVIHVVHKNFINGKLSQNKIHFDIKQITYTEWVNENLIISDGKKVSMLEEKLIDKIKSLGH